jgi:hypothetical protein
MADQQWTPLTHQEVAAAVERRNPPRIPLIRAKWWGEGLEEQYGSRLCAFDRFPEDNVDLGYWPVVDYEKMGLSWSIKKSGGHDASCIIDDWAKLDEFIEKLPAPEETPG